MAKATITFEDGEVGGQPGVKILGTFAPTDYENATPAQGLAFSIKGFIDSGVLPLNYLVKEGIADLKNAAASLREQDAKHDAGTLEPMIIGQPDPMQQLIDSLQDAVYADGDPEEGEEDDEEDDLDDDDDDFDDFEDVEELNGDDDPEDDRVVQD